MLQILIFKGGIFITIFISFFIGDIVLLWLVKLLLDWLSNKMINFPHIAKYDWNKYI